MARPPFPSINDFLQIYNGDMVSGQDPVNLRDTYYPIDQAVAATTFSMPGSSTVITSDYAFDTGDASLPLNKQEPRKYFTKGRLTLPFSGTSLIIRIELDSGWGIGNIYIDGAKPSTLSLTNYLDTVNCNIDTASYPGMGSIVGAQYLDVIVAEGLTSGNHTLDIYANNADTLFFVMSGAKVREYQQIQAIKNGWHELANTHLNDGLLQFANLSANVVKAVTVTPPSQLLQRDGTAFSGNVILGDIQPNGNGTLEYSIDGTAQQDNEQFSVGLQSLYADPSGSQSESVDYVVLMDDPKLTFSSGWSKDNSTPDNSLRAFSTGIGQTVTFTTSASSITFTLQKDSGWGTANVLIGSTVYGTLDSSDPVGGGFLATTVISGFPAGNNTIIVSSLGSSAKPIVLDKIEYSETSTFTLVNETVAVNYNFNYTPPFPIYNVSLTNGKIIFDNPDPNKIDLTIPRSNVGLTEVRMYSRFPTFCVYYQPGLQDILAEYDIVVVDLNAVSRQDVINWQNKGIKVLGYVSIGEEDGTNSDIFNPDSEIVPWKDDGLGTGGYASYYNKGGNLFGEAHECTYDLQRTQNLKKCSVNNPKYFTGTGRCTPACQNDWRDGYLTQSTGGQCNGGFTSSNNWHRDAMNACTNSSCPKYTPVNQGCNQWQIADVIWGQDFAMMDTFPDQNGVWNSSFTNPIAPRWKQKLQEFYLPSIFNEGVVITGESVTLATHTAGNDLVFQTSQYPIDDVEPLVITTADNSYTYINGLDFSYNKALGTFNFTADSGTSTGGPPLSAGTKLLITYTRKGLQCDGLFMDTVDTVDVYPSTDFQQAMVSMIGDLKGGYENKYFCSNRGFTVLNDIIQHCKYVMFESWLVDYNFDTGQYEKITDPDSIAFNNNVKQQLKELRKKYAFDVLSLNYCPNDSSGDELRQYIFDMDMQEGYMSWSSVIDLNSPLPNNEMTTTDANVFKSNVWQLLRKYKV